MLDEMLKMATAAMQNAYSPYSRFKVGACIRTENNELFAGCNVENISYSTTICAESAAIGAMVTAGHTSIKEIVLVSSGDLPCPPCGACRQRILELASSPETKIHLYVGNKLCSTLTIGELLPGAFCTENLEK